MGTPAQLKADLAPVVRMHPAAIERYLQPLVEAELIGKSGPGGGKANYSYDSREYAWISLGLSSFYPGGAAAAAIALGGLFPEDPRPGDASLVTSLAGIIELYARDLRQGAAVNRNDDDWQLTLSLEPLFAVAAWPNQGPEAKRRYIDYPNDPAKPAANIEPPALRRETILTRPLLLIIAKSFNRTPKHEKRDSRAGAAPS